MNDHLKDDKGLGFEDTTVQDYSAPFLVIVQSNSPYVKEEHQLYVPEARPGRILNTQSTVVHKECSIIAVRYKFRNVEWRPRSSGGGFVKSYNREDVLDDLITDPLTGLIKRSNGNVIQQTGYYLCLLKEENWDKVIISMASTQLKKSRRWNSVMMAQKIDGKTLSIFANIYHLTTVPESNAKGTWYGWNIKWVSLLTDPQLYSQARDVYQTQIEFLPERLLPNMSDTDGNDVM